MLVFNADKHTLPWIGVDALSEQLIVRPSEIIILLEIGSQETNTLLHQLDDTYPHSYYVPYNQIDGTLILSDYAILDSEALRLGEGRSVPSLRLDLDGQSIQLLAPHPTNVIYGFDERNTQLDALADYLLTIDEPIIVAGDLNVTQWSSWYKMIERSGMHNSRDARGIFPTWQSPIPLISLPIDHVFVSDAFQVDDMSVPFKMQSDHRPILVSVSLK